MSKRRYLTKAECAEKGWFNKSDLKLERLKPSPGQFPAGMYWQGQGFVDVYDKAQCVRMRPYRQPTPKQLEALARGRELIGTRKCKVDGCSNRMPVHEPHDICLRCAKGAITEHAVVLDTETTGLGGNDQVIEIAVVDWQGSVLINQRIRPTVAIDPDAQAVHGISAADLDGCPSWTDIADQVRDVLEGRPVVIFNAGYDRRMLYQTAKSTLGPDGLDGLDWIINLDTHCAMDLAAREYGATNKYGTISLANAVSRAGIEWQGAAHSALGDALTTLALARKMVGAELVK